MNHIIAACCLFFVPRLLEGQKTIHLANPSFEGRPSASSVPDGWTPCGMEGETIADLQPGSFECTTAPAHGNTYLGMVTRDNYTWECVSQELEATLDSGVCYAFTVKLASSPQYVSYTRLTQEYANYNQPVVFQVWGGYSNCTAQVLLGESPVIAHRDWRTYRFVVRHMGTKPFTHLMLAAYYPPGSRCTPTIGNLLVDDLSVIMQTICPTDWVDTTRSSYSFPLSDPPSSEAGLDTFLEKQLSGIRYASKRDVDASMQCYEGTQGIAEYHNVYLLSIANALQRFPDKKLQLRVKNAPVKILQQRSDALREYLTKTGLGEAQLEVRPLDINEPAEWKIETKWLNANW